MHLLGYLPGNPLYGLWVLLGSHKKKYLSSLILQSAAVSAGTAGYFVLRFYINDIAETGDWRFPLAYFSIFYIVLAAVRGVFSFYRSKLAGSSSEGIVRDLRNTLFDHTQKLSFSYHDNASTGELIQRSTSDVDTIRRFYGDMIPGLNRIFFMFLINFSSIVYLDIKLALLSVPAIPLIIWMSVIFFRKIHDSYELYQEQDGKLSTAVQENLTGIRIVRAFARQKFETDKFDSLNREKLKRGKSFLLKHALYWPASHTICAVQQIFGIITAAMMVINGKLSIGDLVAYIGFLNTIIWPVQQMGRIIAQLSTAWVSYSRVSSVLENEKEDLLSGNESALLSGKIEFRDIYFSYDKSSPVLENINLRCEPGESIALLGETGSGKTTFVNLIPRFYNADRGTLLIDDVPVENYSRRFLREHIGIVEQEPYLFSTTIRENILYGVKREVSESEIIKASEAASVHESIMRFPDKYETVVGEKGVTLSGGQKQRIAIARTILKDPRILILDDSTSAVDAETENNIRETLSKLMKNKTTFIIAHRIQSLVDADQIVVFREGKIIQKGNHSHLIAEEGFYKKVFELQGKIEDELVRELNHG